jgi:hypothetical protein
MGTVERVFVVSGAQEGGEVMVPMGCGFGDSASAMSLELRGCWREKYACDVKSPPQFFSSPPLPRDTGDPQYIQVCTSNPLSGE